MGTSTPTLKLTFKDSYIPSTKCNPHPCHRSHLTSPGVPGGFLRGVHGKGSRAQKMQTKRFETAASREQALRSPASSAPSRGGTLSAAPGRDARVPAQIPRATPRECWECESRPRRASAPSCRAGDPAERRSSSRASARLGTAAGAAPSAVSPARPRAPLRPSERCPPLFPPSRPLAPPAPPPPAPARSRSGAGSGSSRPPGAKAT